MSKLSAALGILAWTTALSAGPGAPPAGNGQLSPAGKYFVVFEEIARRTFSPEERLQALDNIDHVAYEISFLRRDTRAVAAAIRYIDVYGFNQPPEPTPVDRIIGWLSFSPDEDFVVLPGEGWASAPGTPERIVLPLNEGLGWQEARMTLENITWADSLRAVGGRHNDCDDSVDLFDGETGTQRAVVASVSPLGHEIASVEGRTMLIRTALDNCSSEEQRARFQRRCMSLDLDTMILTSAPCPR